jgi:hypothetical protein
MGSTLAHRFPKRTSYAGSIFIICASNLNWLVVHISSAMMRVVWCGQVLRALISPLLWPESGLQSVDIKYPRGIDSASAANRKKLVKSAFFIAEEYF